MICPRDQTPLKKHNYEAQIEVDLCSQCEGMFLEKGELEQIQETTEHDYSEQLSQMPNLIGRAYRQAQEETIGNIQCPKCQGQMERKEYAYCSQVLIDKCLECEGIWLDKGEIQTLEVFFERSQMDTDDVRNVFWRSLYALLGKSPDTP